MRAEPICDHPVFARALLGPSLRDLLTREAIPNAPSGTASQVTRCNPFEHGHAALEPTESGRRTQHARAVEVKAKAS